MSSFITKDLELHHLHQRKRARFCEHKELLYTLNLQINTFNSQFDALLFTPFRSKMSTLTVHQMLQEAIGPITERFKYLRERRNLDKKAGYKIVYDPSFNFVGSDGYLLGVKIFHSTDSESGVVDEVDTIAEEQFYTVISKSGNLKNYPCLTTGKGDLIFVYDPSVSGADTVFQGYRGLADTQKWTQGARVVSDRAPEHVPRPMNA